MNLKSISHASIARALKLAERYRLLGEPDQAASICRDVLAVDSDHQEATQMLLLALTDQFGRRTSPSIAEVEGIAAALHSPYEQAYYRGIGYERWARAQLQSHTPDYHAGEWLRRAMDCYEQAEAIRPEGDDAALLRWNACVRLMERVPTLRSESEAHEHHLGD
ncbi:MAG: hypothetical protein ACK4XJ_04620 [Fimbriimonadaceae bacterium]